MCAPLAAVPAIIAGISAATTVAGTVVSANAQASAGEAQAKGSEFQARQDARNAELAERAATETEARGGREANQVRAAGRRMQGAQRVAYATSGVDVSSGSALDALADTAMMAELDAQTVKANAAREARGYRAQGSQFNQQAAFAREQAGYDRARAGGAVAGTILGGLGQAAAQGANAWSLWSNRNRG